MIDYLESQIAEQATTFAKKGYKTVSEVVNKTPINYFILPQELNPDLPDFAFRMTGKTVAYIIGVSESIKLKFMGFVAFHEYTEFLEIGDVVDRCLEASKREVKAVQESNLTTNEQVEYFQMRRDFFRNLVKYATERAIETEDKDIQEFKKSRDFFEKFCYMG